MKILFLDLDGVLCLSNGNGSPTNEWDASDFDPLAVEALNEILSATDAEMIITSDWRYDYTLSEMRDIFKHFGVSKGPIGYIPSSNHGIHSRAGDINTWLATHAFKNDIEWVVIDDMDMTKEFGNRFVYCLNEKGLSKKKTKQEVLTKMGVADNSNTFVSLGVANDGYINVRVKDLKKWRITNIKKFGPVVCFNRNDTYYTLPITTYSNIFNDKESVCQ
jgi:hypothetical protein